MSLQNKFINLVISGKIEKLLSKDSLICFSFTSEIDNWKTLAEYNEWKLQINTDSQICRVVDLYIIKKVSSSITKMEELIEANYKE